jgi:Membrane bound beta barrel domain (DUF5777)
MKAAKTILVLLFISSALFAQEIDLLALVADTTINQPKREPVYATFKTTRLINAQTIETVKRKTMDFRVTHRFGNIGQKSNGGFHTLWGFDESTDIRISFDFGITDKLQLGFGRSKMNELLDGSVKWRFLEQTKDNAIPISVCFYGAAGITPKRESALYPSGVIVPNKGNFAHRVNYFSQLIVARKFSNRFSLQLLPSYHYRNFVVAYANASNDSARETNGLLVLGCGGRLKLTKRMAIIADYYYIASDFRKNNEATPYENPFSVGLEFETGGHVFHLTFTNASGILENNLIPDCRDQWLKGGFKFGFNISRVFNL